MYATPDTIRNILKSGTVFLWYNPLYHISNDQIATLPCTINIHQFHLSSSLNILAQNSKLHDIPNVMTEIVIIGDEDLLLLLGLRS